MIKDYVEFDMKSPYHDNERDIASLWSDIQGPMNSIKEVLDKSKEELRAQPPVRSCMKHLYKVLGHAKPEGQCSLISREGRKYWESFAC